MLKGGALCQVLCSLTSGLLASHGRGRGRGGSQEEGHPEVERAGGSKEVAFLAGEPRKEVWVTEDIGGESDTGPPGLEA